MSNENEETAVMVLDDDPIVLKSLSEYLRMEGYAVSSAKTLQEGIDMLGDDRFRVILTDVRLPEGSGFDILRYIKEANLATSVIMLTGYGTIEDAVRAIKMGAFDYVTKPIADEEVKLSIERALQQQELLAENRRLRQQLNMSFHLDNLVCRDVKMKRVLDMIKVVAGTDTTILITGQSGTGKTLAARAIHTNSPRRGKPFIEVSCGTLPDTLLESELFGHVKGSFSGAIANKRGKFDVADKGTLFLDEISLASPSLQMKLLRVLESFQFEPVGSNETHEVDVRLILASNQDLGELVKQNKFREDLYYRINVMNIYLSPLKERREDIAPLARGNLPRGDAHPPGLRLSRKRPRTGKHHPPRNRPLTELPHTPRGPPPEARPSRRAGHVRWKDSPPQRGHAKMGAPPHPRRPPSRRWKPQRNSPKTRHQPHHALQQNAGTRYQRDLTNTPSSIINRQSNRPIPLLLRPAVHLETGLLQKLRGHPRLLNRHSPRSRRVNPKHPHARPQTPEKRPRPIA